ncbi:hypothetical protein ASD00_18345 [Ensifer sp. Root31]|uniref:hypothetical protein n=1 Tax=Ensifer sp. Root31 TaxID=1736512 RepID=UPI00070E6CA9|nr:hypothetical protein [Ensifer sp. Root31]KQU96807.1 hypothetical protein ASD00_18345 [Ensifer sp. Root31]
MIGMKSSWWAGASKEQKLAQIDGGIDCDISAKHIAMNVGATVSAIHEYGRRNGRKFTGKNTTVQLRRAGSIAGIGAARRLGKPDCEISSAFSIFGDAPSERPMFDEVLS